MARSKKAAPGRAAASVQVPELALSPDILEALDLDLTRGGVVGEERAKKITYLALNTKLCDQPVSLALKGVTGAGKSYVLKHVLRLFPKKTTYAEFSSASAKAIVYAKGDYQHKFIVFHEAAGITHEDTKTALKVLVSDGRLIHKTVENINGRFTPRTVRKYGPTGLILTTTRAKLDAEIDSRVLSVPITDTPEQTRAILLSMTTHGRAEHRAVPTERWRAFHEWLAQQDNRVDIPYDTCLAELVTFGPHEWRRLFRHILTLIRAHAMLHQRTRDRKNGLIVASLMDYAAVRSLLAELLAVQVGADVTKEIRETVEAVKRLTTFELSVPATAVKRELKIRALSTVQRRIGKAIELGYLQDLRDYRSPGMQIAPRRDLPEPTNVLPTRAQLRACMRSGRKHAAAVQE